MTTRYHEWIKNICLYTHIHTPTHNRASFILSLGTKGNGLRDTLTLGEISQTLKGMVSPIFKS